MGVVLLDGEDHPVITVNAKSDSPFVLVCEHAGRRIPQSLGTLGLLERDLTRHIAWDIGAEGVARNLAELLAAPLVLQRYSRLVYDCNRPPDASDAIPAVSENTDIPANQKLTPAEKLARIREIYRPFHDALATILDGRASQGLASVVVTIHSFTPIYKGVRRQLDLGILHDHDRRFADAMLARLGSINEIKVRRNEPYGPQDGVCHTLNLHAGVRGLRHAMIEIRNDLIGEEAGQMAWAHKLAGILTAASAAPADAGDRAAGAAA